MFDKERSGSGTREWSEYSHNIGRGCSNNCLYCYARADAVRYRMIKNISDWPTETLLKNAYLKSYPKKNGVIMFPTTHDITPFYLPHFIRVALLLLEKGNHLLITSKASLVSMSLMAATFLDYQDRVLFRVTIGSLDDGDCSFWEPGAPLPAERLAALRVAREAGYETSVSIEPMLAGRDETMQVIYEVYPLVSETIWVGKMNRVRSRVNMMTPENAAAVEGIEVLQCDGQILRLVEDVRRFGMYKVRWKDSIKAIMKDERLIEAVCLVFPDGSVQWFEAEEGQEHMRGLIAKWKEQHPEFEGTDCAMGAVHIKMPMKAFLETQIKVTR
jgi:DNA repair photolyase